MVNYAYTVREMLSETSAVMTQLASNTHEQAILEDFPKAIGGAILSNGEAHQEQIMQLLP